MLTVRSAPRRWSAVCRASLRCVAVWRAQILHADGTEESVVLPHVAVRVLDKDSSAEAAARTLLESLASAEAEGGDVETPETAGGRRRKCSPLALATQVRSVANRLPASAVIEQRTKVRQSPGQQLCAFCAFEKHTHIAAPLPKVGPPQTHTADSERRLDGRCGPNSTRTWSPRRR